MNPVLAVGEIVVCVFLIIAILMQARGVGLSSAFGGDSSVYRSRRGIERQLMRFTVLLIVLFVGFSLVGYLQAN
jgi:preprotein translocase subunit SecG